MCLDSPTCKSKLQSHSPLLMTIPQSQQHGALHPQGDWPREEARTGSGSHLNKEFWSPEMCGGGRGGRCGLCIGTSSYSLERSVEAGGQRLESTPRSKQSYRRSLPVRVRK